MTTISERRQRVTFAPSWEVFKWDEADEFIGSMSDAFDRLPADGVKAADIVGVRNGKSVSPVILVGELKDCTHPSIPPHQQAQAIEKAGSSQLRRDIIRKVIDTLSGATFAHSSRQTRRVELAVWRTMLSDSTTKLLILVCIEVHKPAILNMISTDLKGRLRWLGPDVSVLVTQSPFKQAGIDYQV